MTALMEQHEAKRGRPRDTIRANTPVIRQLMEAVRQSRLSDEEIVQRAGVYPSALSKMRSGVRSSRVVTVAAIAGVLGLELRLERK